jgi:hypothetical protein
MTPEERGLVELGDILSTPAGVPQTRSPEDQWPALSAIMMMLWTLPVAATTSSAHVTLTCPLAGLTFFGKHLQVHRLRNTLSGAHSTQFIHRCMPSRLTQCGTQPEANSNSLCPSPATSKFTVGHEG